MPISLIHHPLDEKITNISPFDKVIIEMVTGQDIKIVCPYLGITYIQRLFSKCKTWLILADIEEWIKSYRKEKRKELLNFICTNSMQIRHIEKLHAKVISTSNKALIGSANFTSSGIQKRTEMSVLFENEPQVSEINSWFNTLWQQTTPLEIQEVYDFENSIKDSEPQSSHSSKKLTSTFPDIEADLIDLDDFGKENAAISKKVLTDEHKQKIAEGSRLANSKPVILINKFQHFDSMQTASENIYGNRRGSGYISAVCKQHKKHFKRKVWMFEEDFLKLSHQDQEQRREEALKLEKGDANLKVKEYYIYKNKIYKNQKDISIQLHIDGYIDKSNVRKVEDWRRNLSAQLGQQKTKNCPFLRFGDEFIFFANYLQEYKSRKLINEVPEYESLEVISKKYAEILDINLGDLTVSDLLNSASDKFYKYGGDYFKAQKSVKEKYKEPSDKQISTLTKDDIISELEFLFEDINFKN
jgi:hypothetical protein